MLFWILHFFRLTKFIEVSLTFRYCFKIFTTYFLMLYCSETTIHTCGMPIVITVQFLLLGVHRQLKTCFDKYWFLKYSISWWGPPRRCGWYASLICQNVKIPIQVNSILDISFSLSSSHDHCLWTIHKRDCWSQQRELQEFLTTFFYSYGRFTGGH